LINLGPARGSQVHAHLAVGAAFGKRAVRAYIASLDDPHFTSERACVGDYLIGNERERAREVRAAPDFVKKLSYSVLPGCLHLI
jgi:hypothetical protein